MRWFYEIRSDGLRFMTIDPAIRAHQHVGSVKPRLAGAAVPRQASCQHSVYARKIGSSCASMCKNSDSDSSSHAHSSVRYAPVCQGGCASTT